MPRYYIGQLFDRMDVIPETDLGYLTTYATGKILFSGMSRVVTQKSFYSRLVIVTLHSWRLILKGNAYWAEKLPKPLSHLLRDALFLRPLGSLCKASRRQSHNSHSRHGMFHCHSKIFIQLLNWPENKKSSQLRFQNKQRKGLLSLLLLSPFTWFLSWPPTLAISFQFKILFWCMHSSRYFPDSRIIWLNW